MVTVTCRRQNINGKQYYWADCYVFVALVLAITVGVFCLPSAHMDGYLITSLLAIIRSIREAAGGRQPIAAKPRLYSISKYVRMICTYDIRTYLVFV